MSGKSGLDYIQYIDGINNLTNTINSVWGSTTWSGTLAEKEHICKHEHLNSNFKGNNMESNKEFIPIKVIFNPPATICFFSDGSKVVVKCTDDEEFCEEEGVMACIIKKIFKSRNSFKKLVKNAYRQPTYGKDQWG